MFQEKHLMGSLYIYIIYTGFMHEYTQAALKCATWMHMLHVSVLLSDLSDLSDLICQNYMAAALPCVSIHTQIKSDMPSYSSGLFK